MSSSRLRALGLALLLGVPLGLGVFTFHYASGFSYFSTNPNYCLNCHIMQSQFDSWQKASHHTVATCVDCHLPHSFVAKWLAKADNGYRHSKAFTLQDFHEPIFIRERNSRILHDNCLHCHQDFVHDILTTSTKEGDVVNCIHCHRAAGHGETIGVGRYEAVRASDLKAARERNAVD